MFLTVGAGIRLNHPLTTAAYRVAYIFVDFRGFPAPLADGHPGAAVPAEQKTGEQTVRTRVSPLIGFFILG